MSRIVGYAAVPVDRASAAAAAVVEMPEVGGTDVGTPAGRRRAGRRAARSSRAATRVNAIERRPTDRPGIRGARDRRLRSPTDRPRPRRQLRRSMAAMSASFHRDTTHVDVVVVVIPRSVRRTPPVACPPRRGPRDRPFPRPVTIFTRSAADSGRHSADHSMKLCAQIDLLQHIRRTPLALYTEGARRIPSPANP